MLPSEQSAVIDRPSPAVRLKIKTAMTAQKPNKHEVKTRETRELLLQAAMKIFVRDGYEGAELGEIAALAGRTKGAIYAQFKSKEEVFLALWEQHVLDYRAQMEAALANSSSEGQSLAALRKFYLQMLGHDDWNLLMLEFKLFTMRHPDARQRLHEFYERMIPTQSQEQRLAAILGPAPKEKNAIGRWVAVRTMQPLIGALIVESHFDPELFDDKTLHKIVESLFDTLL